MSEAVEKRQLKMHPKLLLDVIGRQAGSLDKAMLEGGMNAIEAINAMKQNGNTVLDESVYFTYERNDGINIITIKDGGKGITTKKEIEEFFETFGTPHDESEHKIYAQFRMGRGQMFNFGKNVWRTGTFELTVDVLNHGLEWELKENLPFVEGCHITIELYDKYSNSWPAHTVDSLKEAVKKQMEFVFSPVYFNGEQINKCPQDCKWDHEDEFAYYLFNVGDHLKVYNLGVYVRDRWESKGIIVSKHQLRLNFPRNDVMADCPIWQNIYDVVRKNVVNKSQKKYTPLSQNERRSILKEVRDGIQKYSEVKGSRILQTAQNKYMSFSMFLKNKQPWTIAEIGNRQADRCMEKKTHLVFAREMLEALNYSGEDKHFFSWLLSTLIEKDSQAHEYDRDYYLLSVVKDFGRKHLLYESFTDISKGYRDNCTIFTDADLTKVEKRLVTCLESYDCWEGRKIRIGLSSGALAWTDGRMFITLDREYLKSLSLYSDHDIANLFHVLTHELAHNDNTANTDIHGEDFYEQYHEIMERKNWRNPFVHSLNFKDRMKTALYKEREARIKKRQKDEAKRIAKKLKAK